jgi:hypothetical protein
MSSLTEKMQHQVDAITIDITRRQRSLEQVVQAAEATIAVLKGRRDGVLAAMAIVKMTEEPLEEPEADALDAIPPGVPGRGTAGRPSSTKRRRRSRRSRKRPVSLEGPSNALNTDVETQDGTEDAEDGGDDNADRGGTSPPAWPPRWGRRIWRSARPRAPKPG